MRGREPLVIRPWLLPFLVLGLIAPPIGGFALGGPPLGIAIGALEAAGVIVFAGRARFDVPIEVAESGHGYALLVLALDAVEQPRQAERIAEIARAGTLAESPETDVEPEVVVLAPATNQPLAEWLSDLGEARFDAQRRLALSVGTLAAAGIEATGRVGDSDPVQAVEDELRSYPARELVLIPGEDAPEDALAELTRRLPLPVRRIQPDG
jgi:hypothetical protein